MELEVVVLIACFALFCGIAIMLFFGSPHRAIREMAKVQSCLSEAKACLDRIEEKADRLMASQDKHDGAMEQIIASCNRTADACTRLADKQIEFIAATMERQMESAAALNSATRQMGTMCSVLEGLARKMAEVR